MLRKKSCFSSLSSGTASQPATPGQGPTRYLYCVISQDILPGASSIWEGQCFVSSCVGCRAGAHRALEPRTKLHRNGAVLRWTQVCGQQTSTLLEVFKHSRYAVSLQTPPLVSQHMPIGALEAAVQYQMVPLEVVPRKHMASQLPARIRRFAIPRPWGSAVCRSLHGMRAGNARQEARAL